MSKEFDKYIDYITDDVVDGSILTESNTIRYCRGKAYAILLDAFESQCADFKAYPYGSRRDLSQKEEDSRLKVFIDTYEALDRCVSKILTGEMEKAKADALKEYTDSLYD